MVGHQAISPHRDARLAAALSQQIAVERVVGIAEEPARAAVAALRGVVRQAGDDDAGETGHAA